MILIKHLTFADTLPFVKLAATDINDNFVKLSQRSRLKPLPPSQVNPNGDHRRYEGWQSYRSSPGKHELARMAGKAPDCHQPDPVYRPGAGGHVLAGRATARCLQLA
jgi:hypothetical protein